MKSLIRNTIVGALSAVFLLLSSLVMAEDPDVMHRLSTETDKRYQATKGKVKDFFTPLYSFGNVSINYLDWTTGTEEPSGKADFV